MKRRTTITALGAIALAATLGGTAVAATGNPDFADMMSTAGGDHMDDIDTMTNMMSTAGGDHMDDIDTMTNMMSTAGGDHMGEATGVAGIFGPMGSGMHRPGGTSGGS